MGHPQRPKVALSRTRLSPTGICIYTVASVGEGGWGGAAPQSRSGRGLTLLRVEARVPRLVWVELGPQNLTEHTQGKRDRHTREKKRKTFFKREKGSIRLHFNAFSGQKKAVDL